MNVRVQSQNIAKVRSDLLIAPLMEGGQNGDLIKEVDGVVGRSLTAEIRRRKFRGKRNETLLFQSHGRLACVSLLLIGVGKSKELEQEDWRKVGAIGQRLAQSQRSKSVAWFMESLEGATKLAPALLEGFLLASYRFSKYKSANERPNVKQTVIFAAPLLKNSAKWNKSIEKVTQIAHGVHLARDMVNEPPSVSTPSYLAGEARKLSRMKGMKVEVWGPVKIKALKMNGLVAVSRGSEEEPRFIKLSYRPAGKPKKKIALVGKGLTFDSGGLSLKPAKSMETMKLDMSGGAAVIGALRTVAALQPQVQVTGYVPSSENMPGGMAQKPGDIISYRNGKSVEVLNTDAEGRLILADALILAAQEKPDVIIDLATLTGACMVALGSHVAGLFSNNEQLAKALLESGRITGEKLWQLPLVKEYKNDIKSSIADIKNIGGGYGGAITAALFLEEFVSDVPWAHLDIAGPAFSERELSYAPRGGTGFGVRTLVQYVLSA